MAKHRKIRSSRSLGSIRPYFGTGVASAALAGLSVLTAVPNDGPPPASSLAVQLASTGWSLTPVCLSADPQCSSAISSSVGLFGPATAPTPTALLGPLTARPLIGPGGWLIGNGLDAPTDCTGTACNGGDG